MEVLCTAFNGLHKITVDNWCHNNAVPSKYLSEDISSCIFQIFPLAIHLSEVTNHHGCHLHPFISGTRPISNYSFSLYLQTVSCFTLLSIWELSQVRIFQFAGVIHPGTFFERERQHIEVIEAFSLCNSSSMVTGF